MASSATLSMTFLSVVWVLVVNVGVALPLENKIIGGEEADISKIPWQVALFRNDSFRCGGSIIDDYWIITAAHCINDTKPNSLQVRVGSNAHDTGGQKYQVKSKMVHPRYKKGEGQSDIGLMRTRQRITFGDKVAPVKLPASGAKRLPVGSNVTVSGWGITDMSKPPALSPKLMAVEIKTVNISDCESLYEDEKPNETLQICAGSKGRDSCKGDSGGPLASGDILMGIVSYGLQECGGGAAVYTRVSTFRLWIKKNTGI